MLPGSLARPARLVRWGVVGAAATLSYASLTWLLATQVGLTATVSSVCSYALSAFISYFGHRLLTFRSTRPHREALSPFIGVSLAGYGMAFLIPTVVSDILGARVEISILITCAAVPVLNYLGLSRLVFRAPR